MVFSCRYQFNISFSLFQAKLFHYM
uniref:Uncharacterized protein n=1 Tax=Arundo donax TaxID=35708 RepID=A0A0A9C6Y5_ARUDO